MNKKIKFCLHALAIATPVSAITTVATICSINVNHKNDQTPKNGDIDKLLGKANLVNPITNAIYSKVNGNAKTVTEINLVSMNSITKDNNGVSQRTISGTFSFNKVADNFTILVKYNLVSKSYIIDQQSLTITTASSTTTPANGTHIDITTLLSKEALETPFANALYTKMNSDAKAVTNLTINNLTKIINPTSNIFQRTIDGTFTFKTLANNFKAIVQYDIINKKYIIDQSHLTVNTNQSNLEPQAADINKLLGKANLVNPITNAIEDKINNNATLVSDLNFISMSSITKGQHGDFSRKVEGTFSFNNETAKFNITIKYNLVSKSYIIDQSDLTITIDSSGVITNPTAMLNKAFDTSYNMINNKRVYNNTLLTKTFNDALVNAVAFAGNVYDYQLSSPVTYDSDDITTATVETATFIGHANRLTADDQYDDSEVPFSLVISYNWKTNQYVTSDFAITGKSYKNVLSLKNMKIAISHSFDNRKGEVLFSKLVDNSSINNNNVLAPSIKVRGMVRINGINSLFTESVAYNYSPKANEDGYYSVSDFTFPSLSQPFKNINKQAISNAIINSDDAKISQIINLSKATSINNIDFDNNNLAIGSALYQGIALFDEDQNTQVQFYFSIKISYDYDSQTYSATNASRNQPYFASYLTKANLEKDVPKAALIATLAAVTPNKESLIFDLMPETLNDNDYLHPTIRIRGHVESTDQKRQMYFVDTVMYNSVNNTFYFTNEAKSTNTIDPFVLTAYDSDAVLYLYALKIAGSDPLHATFAITTATLKYDFYKNQTSVTIVATLPIEGKTAQKINLHVIFNYDLKTYQISEIIS